MNKKVIECLIKAGAFDGFGLHRAQLIASYGMYIEAAETRRRDLEMGQASLFELMESSAQEKIVAPAVPHWKKAQILAFEKEVLGFYLSDHPLSGLNSYLAQVTTGTLKETVEVGSQLERKRKVVIGGLVSDIREILTKKGTRMAVIQFEDATGSVEVVFFPESYKDLQTLLQVDAILLIEGEMGLKEGRLQIVAEDAHPLDEKLRNAKSVVLTVTQEISSRLEELHKIFQGSPGGADLSIRVSLPDQKKMVMLSASDPESVAVSRELLENVYTLVGRTDFIEMR